MRGPDDGAKDVARSIQLSSCPIGSSGDSSRVVTLKESGERGWFSVILLRYQISYLTNVIRIGFDLASLGREWVTSGPVFYIPPVLFKGMHIFLGAFWVMI